MDSVIRSLVLNRDWRESQVGGHGKVGNSCNHRNSSGDVVENTAGAMLSERQTGKCDCRDCHDSENGPVPVGAMGCDGDVCRHAIDCVAYGRSGNCSEQEKEGNVPLTFNALFPRLSNILTRLSSLGVYM
jgi:hypothetical protein